MVIISGAGFAKLTGFDTEIINLRENQKTLRRNTQWCIRFAFTKLVRRCAMHRRVVLRQAAKTPRGVHPPP
jgi:hypothetical protein